MNYLDSIKLLSKEQGFKIFPCNQDKTPACSSWKETATSDPQDLAALSYGRDDLLAGIKTGIENNLLVFDLDVGEGKDGLAEFKDLIKALGCESDAAASWMSRTRSGGYHIYYKYPSSSGITAHKNTPRPAIDLRGEGGYVIAYDWVDGFSPLDRPLAEIPSALLKVTKEAISSKPKELRESEFDSDGNLIDGRESFKAKLIYKTLAEFISSTDRIPVESEVLELTSTIHNEFERVCGAHKYDLSDRGIDETAYKVNATLKNNSKEDILRKTRDVKSLPFLSFDKVKINAKSNYIIKGLFQQRSLAVVYGAPKAGKSFFMIDAAMAVARGETFNEHKVKQGPVLYCTLEAAEGFKRRLVAYSTHYGLEDSRVPFYMSSSYFSLYTEEGKDELIELIKTIEEVSEVKLSMVVIDTLARTIAPGDENRADDMGVIANHCEEVIKTCETTICLVHHTGKDAARGARGSNALLGALDTEIAVTYEDGARKYTVTNQKDTDAGAEQYYDLSSVVLCQDEDGDDITSCVVRYVDPPIEDVSFDLKGKNAQAFNALNEAILTYGYDDVMFPGHAPRKCVSFDNWVKELERFGYVDHRDPITEAYKLKDKLQNKGAIVFQNGVISINKQQEF